MPLPYTVKVFHSFITHTLTLLRKHTISKGNRKYLYIVHPHLFTDVLFVNPPSFSCASTSFYHIHALRDFRSFIDVNPLVYTLSQKIIAHTSESYTRTSSISCEISISTVFIVHHTLSMIYTLKDFHSFTTVTLITCTLYQ